MVRRHGKHGKHGGKKYLDFAESEPRELECKQAPGKTRLYVSISCPHCKAQFIDIPMEQLLSTKASKCLQHLRLCKEYGGVVMSAPEKKHKDPAIAGLMERMQDMEKRITSHEAVFDVLVNEYGMFRPITDQTVRPQIKMLIDQSSAASVACTAMVTASDAAQLRKQEDDLQRLKDELIVQKDELIAEQKRMLAQKDDELDRAKDELQKQQTEVERIQKERDIMEGKFRAQLKRQRCGSSKSLLSQAEQGQKAYVMKSNLLPKT